MKIILKFCLMMCFLVAPYVHAERIKWTAEQTLKTKLISNVSISPDGQKAIYTTRESNFHDSNPTFVSRFHKICTQNLSHEDLSGLEKFKNIISPKWLLNGDLAFLSNESGVLNLYLLDKYGSVLQITNISKSIESFQFAPAGDKVAFVSEDLNAQSSDTQYYKNENYESIVKHIYLVDLKNPQMVTQLSPNDHRVKGAGDFADIIPWFDFSPDGQELTYTYLAKQTIDSVWKNAGLATVNLNNFSVEIWDQVSNFMAIPRYSPDSKWIAFTHSKTDSDYGLTRYLSVKNRSTGKIHSLSKTPDEGYFLSGPNLLGWNANSTALLYFEPYHLHMNLYEVPVDGSLYRVIQVKNKNIYTPVLSPNSKYIGFVSELFDAPQEAYLLNLTTFTLKQISNENAEISKINLPQTKIINWISPEGIALEGILTLPSLINAKPPYPLILNVHGGPMSAFQEKYIGAGLYPPAAFAENGYAILQINPRGSAGYGRDFRYANFGDVGGGDFRDLMSGIDQLIEQGIVDASRLGIMGWSYGGYMTAWAIGQTDRFKRASMGAGISNWMSMANTTDLHFYTEDYFFGTTLSEKAQFMLERSPIMCVQNVKTPLLIQHGQADPRVPYSQGLEFFNALQKLNKSVEMVGYKDMKHSPATLPQTLHVLESNLKFFNDL